MAAVRPLLYSFPMFSSVPLDAPLPKVFRALATTVLSPASFNAIVLCVETKELLRRLDALIVEGAVMGVDPDELTVGTHCGFRTGEGVVVRVKVTGYNQDRVKLVSYDFGGHLESSVTNLVMLPETLLIAPSLMVTCTWSPSEDGLGTTSVNQLKELVTGKVLKIYWNPSGSVDPTSRAIRCKFEIQDLVVGGVVGEAWPPIPPTPCKAPPKVPTTMEPLRMTNPAGKVCFHQPPRTGTFVICPHVVHSPSSMWILLQHPDIVHFKRLQDDLNSRYQHTTNDSYVPERGEMCAVLRGEDRIFYRAQVLCVNNDGSFDIQYVDFGNCETVGLDNIRHLDQVFLTLPRQALKAALAGIAPSSPTNMWSMDCVFHVRKKMIGQHLIAEIVAESKGTYYLSVQDPDSTPAHFIHNGLVDLGFAKYVQGHFEGEAVYMSHVPCLPPMMMEVLMKQTNTLRDTVLATPVCASGKAPPIAPPLVSRTSSTPITSVQTKESAGESTLPVETTEQAVKRLTSSQSSFKPSVTASPREGGVPMPREGGVPMPREGGVPKEGGVPREGGVFSKRKLPVIVPPLDKVLSVQATHIETPYAFWMQMADPQSKKKLNDLTTAINKTTLIVMTNPSAGSLCLARSSVDGIVHRGQVASVSGVVKVQFLDYGSKEDVSGRDVYEVGNSSFVELSAQAMFCTLNSLLHPRGKEARWEAREVEGFESILPLGTQLKMKVVKTIGVKHVVDVLVPSGEGGDSDLLTLFCKMGLGSALGEKPCKSEGFDVKRNKEQRDARSECRLKDEGIRRQSTESTKDGRSGVKEGPAGGGLPQGGSVRRKQESPATKGGPCSPALLPPTRQGLPEEGVPRSSGSSPMLDEHLPTLKIQGVSSGHPNIEASSLPVTGIFKDDKYTLITVTTVDTPHSFYIQAVAQSSIDELNQLSVHLSAITSSSQLLKSSVTKGNLCCAKFSKDGSWYRAEVKEVSDTHCLVHFLDYGNTDRVVWSDIVHCPVECTYVPIQAIRCALFGVIPLGSKWSLSATEAMQKLTVDRPLLGRAYGQLPDGSFRVELIDTSGENDVDIGAELVLMGVASLPESSSKPPSSLVAPKQLTNIKASSLPVATIFSGDEEFTLVTVTTVDTPHCFYLQAVTQSSVEKLTLLSTELQQLLSTSSSQLVKSSVAKGDLCCAKFSKDGSWYRAEVKEVSDTHCLVHFLDYGNTDRVVWSDIVHCPVEYTSISIQAVQCALFGVVPQGSKWSPSATEAMQKLTVDRPLLGRAHGQLPDRSFHVELIDTSGKNDVDIGAELVLMGVAGLPESSSKPPSSLVAPKQLTNIKASSLPVATIFSGDEEFTLVTVTTVDTPHCFYLQAVTQSSVEKLALLSTELQQLLSTSSSQLVKSSVAKGDLCCAMFSKDGSWYRAEVKELSDTHCLVHFLDYGNTDRVVWSDIVHCPVECTYVPIQAIRCALFGVVPQGSKWSPSATEAMQNLTVDRPLLGRAHGQLPDGSFSVELIDTSGENDVDIGAELVQMDVAGLPESSSKPPSSLVAPKQLTNIKASSLPVATIFSGDEEFTLVTVTTVDTPHCFYLQAVTQSSVEKLTLLSTELQQLLSTSSSQLVKSSVAKGDLCCAKFSKDGSWYRAEVKELSDTHCLVHFLDYGNTDRVVWSDIVHCPVECTSISIQAVQCALFGVIPLGSKWSQSSAEALKELTVDKVLHARVLGSQLLKEPTLQVELVSTSGDSDINIATELISMELATSPLSPAAQHTIPSVPPPHLTSLSIPSPHLSTIPPLPPPHLTSLSIPSPHLPTSPSIPPPYLPSDTFRLYVSDVTSPSSFHIHHHDVNILSELQSLMEQLQVAYASPAPYTPFQALPGASCCAQFTDGAFYRCVVVKVDSVGVTLNYVDYGNNYVVPASGVFRLDPKFASLPAMAIHCSLADVCPTLKDQWSHDAMQAFKSLVFPSRDDVTHLKGRVVVRDTVPVKVQLFLLDSGQSCVADILVDQSVAISTNSLVPPGTIFNLVPPTLSQTEFPVSISHIESPTKLYVNPLGPNYTKMAAGLQGDINAYSTRTASFNTSPKPGSLTIGLYKDGNWFRVRILQCLKSGKCEVQYVDFGDKDVLSLEQLKPFSDRFLSTPEQVFQCALYGITAQETLTTSSALRQAVVSSLLEGEHVCHVVCRHPLIVDFRPSGNHGNLTMHSSLVRQKLLPQSTLLRLPSVSISSEEGSTVLPTVVVSPSEFWVQTVDEDVAQKLAVLLERMNQFCNSRPLCPPGSPLVLGQLCCAKFSEDGCWYRARIIDFNGETEIKAAFVDFGNSEWTSLDHIQEIREDFACLPEAAVHCCLIGYESKAMCDAKVARVFKSLVENKKFVAIKKGDVGVFQTIVELVDTSSDQDVYIHKVISSSSV